MLLDDDGNVCGASSLREKMSAELSNSPDARCGLVGCDVETRQPRARILVAVGLG